MKRLMWMKILLQRNGVGFTQPLNDCAFRLCFHLLPSARLAFFHRWLPFLPSSCRSTQRVYTTLADSVLRKTRHKAVLLTTRPVVFSSLLLAGFKLPVTPVF